METERVVLEQTSFEPLPAGSRVIAEIAAIELMAGSYGPQLRWKFAVVDSDRTLVAFSSTTFSNRSKCYAWTKAALRREIGKTEKFDSALLIGERVELTLAEKQNPNDGSVFNIVWEVAPIETQKRFGGIFG